MSPTMKQAPLLFLSACTLLAAAHFPAARAEGVITLKSGESLPGKIDALQDQYLKVQSRILSRPVDLKVEELDQITSSVPLAIPEQFSIIRLENGDELYGTLKSLDAESLQLETSWGGLLPVNRNHVRYIGFDKQKAYLRNATESLQGWTSAGNSMLPECRNGSWIMRGSNNTELQTKFDMPPRLHVQFSVYHTNSFRVHVFLWNDDNSQNKVEMTVSLEKAELNKVSSGHHKTIGRVKRQTERNWYSDKGVKRSDVQFYADREKGNYYLYLNGKQIARWEEGKELQNIFENEEADEEEEDGKDAKPHDFKPGNILGIRGYDSQNMALNNMNVLEWNGALPYPPEEQDIVGKYDRESSTDKVMLVNGDVLRGSISLQEDGRIRVKSNHYDVIVPTSKVRSLNQKKEEEKKVAQDNSDVRVFLADQSIVSIRLDAVRDGRLEGHSSALGKVSIPIQSLRKVLFNLQSPELKKQRENPFLGR